MAVTLTNNAVSRLASSLTVGATTLSVSAGDGAKYPSPSAGAWFPVTLVKASGALEIVRCTSRTGDVLTVSRAQEGTAAQAFSAGDRVELRLTAAAFTELQTLISESLRKDDNLASLVDKAISRANLGLKTGAVTDAQTSAVDVTAGRLLIVGGHGVGAGVTSLGVSNLNEAVIGSFIEVNGLNSEAAANNWPVLVALDGAVGTDPVRYEVTTSGSADYVVQRAVFVLAAPSRVTGRAYIRIKINGAWQAWGADFVEGVYGYGRKRFPLASTDNLNSLPFGRYVWSNASLPVNYPFSAGGFLDVIEQQGADMIQVATDLSNYQQWRRTSSNGGVAWSAWKRKGGVREADAYVRFTGTGTPAIVGSYNVSSVTRLGVGYYRITFATPLDLTTYSTIYQSFETSFTSQGNGPVVINQTATFIDIANVVSGTQVDRTYNSVHIFGGSNG